MGCERASPPRRRRSRRGVESPPLANSTNAAIELGRVVVVGLEMVGFDVGDDRDLGTERQERPVGLVALDHEPLAVGPHRARADLVDVTTDDERRDRVPASTSAIASIERGGGLAVRCRRRRSCGARRADRREDDRLRTKHGEVAVAGRLRPRGCGPGIAVLIATSSASPRCAGVVADTCISIPSTRRRSSTGPPLRSDPVTV